MSQDASSLKARPSAPIRSFTPGAPDSSNDFLSDQIKKQQASNFHSSSLNKSVTMVVRISNGVQNLTCAHPCSAGQFC